MKWLVLCLVLMHALGVPVSAMDFQAPAAPQEVREIIPEGADSFPQGLWNVFHYAVEHLAPSLQEAGTACAGIGCVMLLCGIAAELTPGKSGKAIELCGVAAISASLMDSTRSLLALGADTIRQLSDYGKLFLPVMASSLAAQGGAAKSTGLLIGTAALDAVLSAMLSGLLLPGLGVSLALGIGSAAVEVPLLERLHKFGNLACGWVLKGVLTLFTAYMTLTGVVSGSADAMALRAAKMTISTAVPVVGGILSDASEAVLVSAGYLGSGAGIYGILTVLAVFGVPFIRLGTQYGLLKAAAALGSSFCAGGCARVTDAFAQVLGQMLGIVGTQSVLLLISTVCFMKGVA